MRLIVISFYSGVIFVLQSNQETTFAYPLTQAWPSSCARAKSINYCYPLTQAWPSSCSQTKRQLLLILLLRHSLRLALGQSSALLILAHAIAVVHASEPLHQ